MCSAGPATKAAIAPETAVAVETPIRDQEGRLLPLAQPLKVCLMSADFPGLPNAGHISTAFTLLAAALGTDPSLKVSLPPLKLMKQRHHGQVSTGLFRASQASVVHSNMCMPGHTSHTMHKRTCWEQANGD